MPQPQVITEIYDGKIKVAFSPGRHTYTVDVPGVCKKRWFPSVTGILGVKAKPQLTNWAAKKSLEFVTKKIGGFESNAGSPPFLVDTNQVHSWISEAEEGWNDDTDTSIGSLAHRFLEAEMKHRADIGPAPERPRVDPVLAPNFTPAMIDAANHSITAGITFLDEHDVKPLMLERVLFSALEGYIGTADFIGHVDGELVLGDWKSSKRLYVENWVQLAAYSNAYFEEFGQLILHRYLWNIKKDGTGLEFERRGIDQYTEDLDAFRACLALYSWERNNDPWKKGIPVQPLGADWNKAVTEKSK